MEHTIVKIENLAQNDSEVFLIGIGIGFLVGMLIAWLLTRSRAAKRVDALKLEADKERRKLLSDIDEKSSQNQSLEDEVRSLKHSVVGKEAALDICDKEKSSLQQMLDREAASLKDFQHKNDDLSEKLRDAGVIKERLASREQQLTEEKQRLARSSEELDRLKKQIVDEVGRRASAEERLARLVTLEEQIDRLDGERSKLLIENSELKKTRERLDKLEQIKDLYEKTLEENNFLKQQSMLRHFLEIKKGLDKTVQAFNKTCTIFDRKVLLASSDILEADLFAPIEPQKIGFSKQVPQASSEEQSPSAHGSAEEVVHHGTHAATDGEKPGSELSQPMEDRLSDELGLKHGLTLHSEPRNGEGFS